MLHAGQFHVLRAACQQRGWHAVQHTEFHWQVKGALAKPVNLYWNLAGELRIHVSGAVCGAPCPQPTLRAVLDVCDERTEACPRRHKRKQLVKARRRLWRRAPICHWCRKRILFAESTVDHIIALSQGGSNAPDNLCLACRPCNMERGNSGKAYQPPTLPLAIEVPTAAWPAEEPQAIFDFLRHEGNSC